MKQKSFILYWLISRNALVEIRKRTMEGCKDIMEFRGLSELHSCSSLGQNVSGNFKHTNKDLYKYNLVSHL